MTVRKEGKKEGPYGRKEGRKERNVREEGRKEGPYGKKEGRKEGTYLASAAARFRLPLLREVMEARTACTTACRGTTSAPGAMAPWARKCLRMGSRRWPSNPSSNRLGSSTHSVALFSTLSPYQIFSQQKYSSAKYSVSKEYSSTKNSVSRNIPVQNIQSVRNMPVQNIQLAEIFQYKIFSP